MATVLQQQLAAIASHSTHQLDLKAQKARHGKSLLYSPRDAASQSFDTIFSICREGFEELCQLDARYLPFAKSLFSEQSKNEDRLQMTAKENEDLDRLIERFLGLLSARLLLQPALQAAEWLVRRFQAHEYNTEAMLLTFLPYHTHRVFDFLLPILPEVLPSNFRFLHPYVASRDRPPRHAIITAIIGNSAFFAAFSRYVLNVAKLRHHSALLLGFWASATAQAVNGMIDITRSGRVAVRKQKEEDLLLNVLPVLQAALSIKGISELYLGAGMIMTILASRASPGEKVLDAMMEAVARGWTEQTFDDGMICLAVVCQEKQNLTVPLSVSQAVLALTDPIISLQRAAQITRIDKLLSCLCFSIVATAGKDLNGVSLQFLKKSFKSQLLPRTQKIRMVESFETSTAHDTKLSSHTSAILELTQISGEANHARAQDEPSIEDLSNDETVLNHEHHDSPKEDFAGLLEAPSESHSFLRSSAFDKRLDYLAAFETSARYATGIDAFLDLPLLQRDASTKRPNFFSFLAYAWSSGSTVVVRRKALEVTREALDKMKASPDLPESMQALLLYVLSALADSEKPVRIAAASVCKALSELSLLRSSRSRISEDTSIWAKTSLYDADSVDIPWMSDADLDKFLTDALRPILENCVIDARHILQALPDILNGHSDTLDDRKVLKGSLRTDLCAFLFAQVCITPVLSTQLGLLQMLSSVEKPAGPARTKYLLPYVCKAALNDERNLAQESRRALLRALLNNITHRSLEELDLLRSLAIAESGDFMLTEIAFERIRTVWPSLKEQSQISMADWLLSLSLPGNATEELQSQALDTLRDVSLSSSVLVHFIHDLPAASALQDQPSAAKKPRTSRVSIATHANVMNPSKLDAAVRRMTLVLDLIEASTPEMHPRLLKGLFHLLSELHHYRSLSGSELAYLQGSLINSLLCVVDGLRKSNNKNADRSSVRADLIVECVRTTSSTQIHHAALLLMSSLAAWAPDLVLHSVMPLFTFMSSTILKQSDDYSAHVTEQTVARIIPPLATSLKKSGKDVVTGAADLILSFAAAFEHIPVHRRAGLFRHLTETLGPVESLFAIMAILIERYTDEPSVPQFLADLMDNFSTVTQLQAVKQYLGLVFDTLKPKRNHADLILAYGEKTGVEARQATSSLIKGLAEVLSWNKLPKRLAKDLRGSNDVAEQLRGLYSGILESTMDLKLQNNKDVFLHKSIDGLLAVLLRLMPIKDFIDASASLMPDGTPEIRQQVFQSLEQRASTAKRGDTHLGKILLGIIPNCTAFVRNDQPVQVRHAAIACIDQIVEKYGKTGRDLVMEAAKSILSDAALSSNVESLRIISILCLATMVEVLEADIIPFMPKALERILTYLADLEGNVSLHRPLFDAISAFFNNVLDHTDMILSGKHLNELFLCGSSAADSGEYEYDNVREVFSRASRRLSPEYVLTAIKETWQDLHILDEGRKRLYVQTLRSLVKFHGKATIGKNSELLFSILLPHMFDLRAAFLARPDVEHSGEQIEPHLESLFALVNDTAMDIMLKLNDVKFRPFYSNFVEWSMREVGTASTGIKVQRCRSLYSFTLIFSEQLKSLVTNYGIYLLESAPELLIKLDSESWAESGLLDTVIQALASMFRHDQDGFWSSPSHFDAVAKPLLKQLERASIRQPEEHVIPALVDLAAAAGSTEHYRAMNAIIMTYMRNEDPLVRLAAVKCERAVTDKLNIDWLAMLPEMLPFINELQEDDNEAVERETLRWMNQMEEITGQSIQDMLR